MASPKAPAPKSLPKQMAGRAAKSQARAKQADITWRPPKGSKASLWEDYSLSEGVQNRDARYADYVDARSNQTPFVGKPRGKGGPTKFNPKAKLDPKQVDFVRGMESMGGKTMPPDWMRRQANSRGRSGGGGGKPPTRA